MPGSPKGDAGQSLHWNAGIPIFIFSKAKAPPETTFLSLSLFLGQDLSDLSSGTRMDLTLLLLFWNHSMNDWWQEGTVSKLVTWAMESSMSSFIELPWERKKFRKIFFHEEMNKSRHTLIYFQNSNKRSHFFFFFYPRANSYLSRQHICFASFISPLSPSPEATEWRRLQEASHRKASLPFSIFFYTTVICKLINKLFLFCWLL